MATNTASNSFSQDRLLGKTVGNRYEILRLIGRGGVGLVYLAHDDALDREVVVKVLSPHWAEDPDAVARFDREALRMATLDHANVVKMYDHGHFEGRAYIVMEFIRGEPLRGYLNRRKRLPLEEFVPIAAQVLLGVGYVHERGIMMRDIKPPNIMLCERDGKANHVKMLDFGLARLIEEDEDEVTKSHVIGTAAYMSPEQIKGEKIDVRVDVYALGVLFFLMLTGETPISGDNDAAVLINHVHGKPKSLVERLPSNHRIPPELIALIESCLAKDPDDRPSDASSMVEALFEFIPAPLLELPTANAKTRAAAESYWSTRLTSGPAAVAALESDTNDSAEFTRPLLRKAARTGQSPLKVAEEEIAAQREAEAKAVGPAPEAQAEAGRASPRSPTGSGLKPRPRSPTGSGLEPRPRSPTGSGLKPRPRSPTGSGLEPRTTEGSGVSALPPRPPPPPPPSKGGSGVRPMPRSPSASGLPSRTRSAAAPVASTAERDSGLHVLANLDSAPDLATIRVSAADAKEAVERFDAELERRRTGRVPTVPVAMAFEPDLADGVPISIDDDEPPITFNEDTGPGRSPNGAVLSTTPNDRLRTPVSVVAPLPQPPDSGMRLGIIVAVAGLAALALGGLSAYLVFGGGDNGAPTAPATVDSTPAATVSEVPSVASNAPSSAPADTPSATSGTVEVSAIEGARVVVDGEDRGMAPVQLDLSLGEHRIRVSADGHYPWETTITVSPGANAAVKAELVKAEAGSTAPPPSVAAKSPKGPKGTKGTKGPKSDADEPAKPETATPDPFADTPKSKGKGKSDPEVFLESSKGKDDGIFLPVGQ